MIIDTCNRVCFEEEIQILETHYLRVLLMIYNEKKTWREVGVCQLFKTIL